MFSFLLSEVVSTEPFYKPVPKPRSKTLDKPAQLDKTQKHISPIVSQTLERASSDDSRSDSLSSPNHESLHCVSGGSSSEEANETPSAMCQGDGEAGNFSLTPPQTSGSCVPS